MKNIILFLSDKLTGKSLKKYFFFVLLKYLEVAITACLFFLLARMVGPEEYGKATSSFLLISYSSFALLGVNQVLVKWYAIHSDLTMKLFLVRYNLLYNLITCLLVGIGVIIFFNPYKFFITGIIVFKLIQESFVNINRANQNIFNINIIYISFALVFLVMFLLFVHDIGAFFSFWLLSIFISTLIGSVLTLKKVHFENSLSIFLSQLKNYWKALMRDGVKLALMGAILPLFLNIDRLILINFSELDDILIGNMQLADNIATVVSFGISSLFFIITPTLLTNLKNGTYQISKFYFFSYRAIFLTLGIMVLIIPLILLFSNYLFSDYTSLSVPLIFYLLGRILYLAFFAITMICISFSRETSYLRIVYFWFIVTVVVLFCSFYILNKESLVWLFPGIMVLALSCIHIHFYILFNQSLKYIKVHQTS